MKSQKDIKERLAKAEKTLEKMKEIEKFAKLYGCVTLGEYKLTVSEVNEKINALEKDIVLMKLMSVENNN